MIKTEKKKTKKEVKDLLFGRRAKIKKVKCVICNQIKQLINGFIVHIIVEMKV